MAYWLLKTEPGSYSWADLVRDGGTDWDGVRNAAATLNLRAMRPGDLALIYHSVTEKAAVGVARITGEARADGPDDRWAAVAIEPVSPLPRPVTLAAMKADARLAGLQMIRQSRLSVSPIIADEWTALTELGGGWSG